MAALSFDWVWNITEAKNNTVYFNSELGSILIYANDAELSKFALLAEDATSEEKVQAVLDYTDGYAVKFSYTYSSSQIADGENIGACLVSSTYGASCWVRGQTAGTLDAIVSKLYKKADFADSIALEGSTPGTIATADVTGSHGTWDCEAAVLTADLYTQICNRYLPNPELSADGDYRFSPNVEDHNEQQSTVKAWTYQTKDLVGAAQYSEFAVTLTGAVNSFTLGALAAVSALYTLF